MPGKDYFDLETYGSLLIIRLCEADIKPFILIFEGNSRKCSYWRKRTENYQLINQNYQMICCWCIYAGEGLIRFGNILLSTLLSENRWNYCLLLLATACQQAVQSRYRTRNFWFKSHISYTKPLENPYLYNSNIRVKTNVTTTTWYQAVQDW